MENIYGGLLVAVLSYLFLMLFEESFGVTKTKRLIAAAILGILFYKYGHTIVPWIHGVFSYFGL